jgi:hypothetical protein
MAPEILKLTSGKNSRLYSITTTLSTLCMRYLAYDEKPELDSEEREVIEKGRLYLNDVRKGLVIKSEFKTRPFSFDPETIHSLNALQEVFIVAKNEDRIIELLDTVNETLEAINLKYGIDHEKVKTTVGFFDNLSEVVGKDAYNDEASHRL